LMNFLLSITLSFCTKLQAILKITIFAAAMKRIAAIVFLIVLSTAALAQGHRKITGTPMLYEVTAQGDTIFLDSLEPIWVFPRGRAMKRDDWRKEYRLIYNFNKVYPFALVGRKMMAQVDSTITADVTKRSQRTRYVNAVERELLHLFEQDIRHMTVTQGMVLMRLVDRECGMSAYDIVKTYESGFAANFWQLVARLFSQDLKMRYDPKGKDAKIEELVSIWDSGNWDKFYYSVFWEMPPRTDVHTQRLSTVVN